MYCQTLQGLDLLTFLNCLPTHSKIRPLGGRIDPGRAAAGHAAGAAPEGGAALSEDCALLLPGDLTAETRLFDEQCLGFIFSPLCGGLIEKKDVPALDQFACLEPGMRDSAWSLLMCDV